MPGSSFVCLSFCVSLKKWVGNENSYKRKCRKSFISSLLGSRRWELSVRQLVCKGVLLQKG